jgi:AraC-like DNA-binding protein
METIFPAIGPAQEYYNVIDANAGLGVLFAGHERNAPGHGVQTVRDHFLFHYVLEGRGTFGLGRKTWNLGPGDGFLLAPGVAGRYAADPRRPWVYAWVGFHGRDAARLLPQVGFDAGQAVLEASPAPQLAARLVGLVAILRDREPGFSLAAEGQMLLVLADLARLAGPRARVDMAAKAAAFTWAEAAAEFIQTNHHRAIGVEAVAAYVGFSPSHLGRLFRAHYGTTVQAWLARTRIERAKLLLRTTDRPVSEVARSVGFRDYAPFEKRFRALTSTSPTEYRRGEFFV